MVVLDQFYQIVESPTAKVSGLWKVAQTFTFIVSALCGFTTAFTFGRVLNNFNYNCLLKSVIVFDNSSLLNVTHNGHIQHSRAIDLTYTTWGPSSECNFAQFTPLFIMISAIVWGTFLVIMAKGGAGYATDLLSRPWRFLYPCIIFTVILFIIYLVSTLRLRNGIDGFCEQFQSEFQFNSTTCTPEINIYTQQFHSENYDDVMFFNVHLDMLISIICSDIGIWSWVVQLILCVSRVCCVADFDLQLVTIVSKEEEQVEKVIEFHDISEV